MKTILNIAVPAFSILVAMMVWIRLSPTSEVFHKKPGSEATIRESKTISAKSAHTINIDSDAGNVQLIGGRDGSVLIDAEKHAPTEAEAEKMTYRVENRGNTIRIVYREPDRGQSDRRIDFTIHAPIDTVLLVSTGGGNIDASGFSQGISGRTAGGNLRAANVSGPVRLDTGGGNIDVGGLDGAVDLSSGGGNIEAFGNLRDTAVLRTDGGNITAQSVTGEVKAQTGAGNIFVGGRLTGNSLLSTDAGNIDAIVPKGSSLRIHAAASMGHIHDSFGLRTTAAQELGPVAMSGQVGSGANSLTIQTGLGNVSIQNR